MIRAFSFILGVFFLWLSVKTCSDIVKTTDNCQTASCVHLETGHTDNHSEDSCSPFCTCQCCGGITLIYEFLHGFKESYTSLEKPLYSENSLSEISFSIWQPPKI